MRCFILSLGFAAAALGQETVAELKERIARLEAEVEALSAQLEGTAKPVNLARTSLAAVSASSVNGGRALDDRFYGALKLFDEDADRTYPYWLTNGEPRPWVEIRFDTPVTVAALEVEGGGAWTARFRFDSGGEEGVDGGRLPKPRAGVRSVRFTFAPEKGGPLKVHELRVLGFAGRGVEYRAGLPRVRLTKEHAVAVARARYRAWKEELLGNAREVVSRSAGGGFEIRFYKGERELLRVVVAKGGDVKVEPRVALE